MDRLKFFSVMVSFTKGILSTTIAMESEFTITEMEIFMMASG